MSYKQLEISEGEVARLVYNHYGLKGQIKRLAGEVDFNFYFQAQDNTEYTIKISRPNADRKSVEFQNAVLGHLTASGFPLQLPSVLVSKSYDSFVELDRQRILRCQSWVNGRVIEEVRPRSSTLLQSWGKACGLLSFHLVDFDHPFAHRTYKWNPSLCLDQKVDRKNISDAGQLEIADYFWNLFEVEALPRLATLRKSVNYNDAHELNLLTADDSEDAQVTGIVDFGDALYTETINELAIACAYAAMGKADPLEAICQVVRGYHGIFNIEEEELMVLFPLIAARLLITVSNAARNKQLEPENEYLLVSEKPAWDLLIKMQSISPELALFSFREICGLEPCLKNKLFIQWVSENKNDCASVVDFKQRKVVRLDLSVGSLDLGNNTNFENIDAFQRKITDLLEVKNGEIGLGGYGEIRPFYTTDAFKVEDNYGAAWRTVHLGMDVWAPAYEPIFALIDGVVYNVQNNVGEGNYGPTIILEHRVSDELIFYTLYGHLSPKCLLSLREGMEIKKGEHIGEIGAPPTNGNWPPHLHFQIILDMLGNIGDFPGVAFPEKARTWLSISPDPGPLFSMFDPVVQDAMTSEAILAARGNVLADNLSISYRKPLHMVRGYMQHLYDSSARRYLDTVNNVPHVGHQHPVVVAAAQRQIGLLNTNTRYLHENIVLYAEELLSTLPDQFKVVYFVNSGSEANELALRMVEAYTGQKDMVAIEVGYHGNTGGCVGVSSYKFDGKGGKGAPPTTQIVPIPDTYRGLYRDECEPGLNYAQHVKEAINRIESEGRKVGGFICESIISCGGQVVLPEGYLQEAYRPVHEAGGLCIADEVQVGLGRVGDFFWGFELQGVVPDIVTMGKPLGNGHPLAAVVTHQKVADAFANGMEYFNTFGGNPVSCAIGRSVLRIVREEGLQEHAKKIGGYLTMGLKELQNKFSIIGNVRGHGLFLGFELVRDRDSLEPADREAAYLVNRMCDRGILMSTDGPHHNVLKIKPPMCFSRKDAEYLIDNLDVVFREDFLRI